jgi:predicted unusual protein kinase regulating ubiquinone biosynthesis (AarF/ABC1/UbiB family)
MEDRNTEESRRFLAENKLLNKVTAPKVYQELTVKKVRTIERLDMVLVCWMKEPFLK